MIDRPAVGERLEQRKVAEVNVRQHVLEILKLLGRLAELAAAILDAPARRPVQALDQRAVGKREEP